MGKNLNNDGHSVSFPHRLCNTEESKETGGREQNRPNRSCLQPTEWTVLFFRGTITSPQNIAAGWILYLCCQTSKMPLGCVRRSRWKRIVDIRGYKKTKWNSPISAIWESSQSTLSPSGPVLSQPPLVLFPCFGLFTYFELILFALLLTDTR